MAMLESYEPHTTSHFENVVGDETMDTAPLAHNLDSEKKRTVDIQPGSSEVDNTTAKSLERLPESIRFSDLQVSPPILRGLTEAGFSRPSPVQIKAIPFGRMGMDLIVQAKSGTGKTVVFAVVLLEAVDTQRPALQALVLAPTREIALQSQNVLERLGTHLPGLKCRLFVGGLPLADNLKHLPGCHIAVGTPGRIRYLIETGYMTTENIRHLVLDEADLLLAGGAEADVTGGSANNAFPADINYIWWSLSPEKQMIALSATYTDYLVEEHLQRYMNDPVLVRLAAHDPALLGVRQFFATVEPPNRSPASVFAAKVSYLCKLLSSVDFQQCLIFSNFHSSAQELCDALHSRGWPVSYISSNLDQSERFRAFNRLRAFHCRVLVSTDLTSRGIDAENVNLVVSLEVPWEHEIYLHRVGRAGRFGSYGASILIVADVGDELNLLRRLQSRCPTKIRKLPEPTPADLAAPNCPVDLDSLVTVVNCVGKQYDQKSARPPHRTVPRQKKGTGTVDLPESIDPDRTVVSCPSTSGHTRPSQSSLKCIPEWSQLSKAMNIYLDRTVGGLEGFLKGQDESKAVSIDVLERQLLKSLEALYAQEIPLVSNGATELEPTTDEPPKERNFPPPLREPPKHVNETDVASKEEQHANQRPASSASNQQPSSVPWTQRQIEAWYEYHNLVNHAYWYRASWELAMDEYRASLEKWNTLNAYASVNLFR
ncbi:DEAD box ATP dependent RNA helicase [Fasciola hepatica]|uniref:RNA helicase n=1 Tax=Fasciola hepatica TaxID=6192 RepID=A0A4E0QWQ0_FASHE|nr:DEAD box ATP dependent RNA helicase [Fasciola hepatica]